MRHSLSFHQIDRKSILHQIDLKNLSFQFFDSIAIVDAEQWNRVVDQSNIYLSIPYLSALESALKSDVDFRYAVFYSDKNEPVAVSYFQLIQIDKGGNKYAQTLNNLSHRFKTKMLNSINARILICGNVFASGENGFVFSKELNPRDAFKMLARSMKALSQNSDENGHVSFGLYKEVWPSSVSQSDHLFDSNFKGFFIDVNMVLPMHSSWHSLKDYLESMTTKYRTKAKGVLKKSAELVKVDLSLDELKMDELRIQELYSQVLNQADFKLGELNSHAFQLLKQNLGDRFTFSAYYLGNKMVGFITLFEDEHMVDANCMGLDYEFNREYAVYQRMLFDAVEYSIQKGVSELRLGRTAELLKSSIGANPVNMKLYLRHRNGVSNKMIGPLISSITPSEYELRPPFKKEFLA